MSTPASIGRGARSTGATPPSTPGLPAYEPVPASVSAGAFVCSFRSTTLQPYGRGRDSGGRRGRLALGEPHDPDNQQREHHEHRPALDANERQRQVLLGPDLRDEPEDADRDRHQYQPQCAVPRPPRAERPDAPEDVHLEEVVGP